MSSFFFNRMTLDELNNVTGKNFYDTGSGLTQGTTIQNQQVRSLINWALGDIYQTFDPSGSTLTTGEQYPEFVIEFKSTVDLEYMAFGNHTIGSASDGWVLYNSADGVTYTQVTSSAIEGFTTDNDKVVGLSGTQAKYWKIQFLNVQVDFKIGVFAFCKRIDIPHLKASLTHIDFDMVEAATKDAYGSNYHTTKFEQSFDNLAINLNNIKKSWIDANAKTVLNGIKDPFLFFYEYSDTGFPQGAYCLQTGKSRGVQINNNHLYSLPIKTKARSWS